MPVIAIQVPERKPVEQTLVCTFLCQRTCEVYHMETHLAPNQDPVPLIMEAVEYMLQRAPSFRLADALCHRTDILPTYPSSTEYH